MSPAADMRVVRRLRALRWPAVGAALLGLALAGCSAPPKSFQQEERPGSRSLERGEDADRRVYLDLIGEMLEQQQFYAALAHVEEYRIEGRDEPRLSLYEARALLGLDYDGQAQALFLQMLDGPLAAEAHHGLGLIYARRDLDKALPHFIEAVRKRPTSVVMRNDLGYALMQQGRFRDAQLQLSTALELDAGNERARDNLMLLMLQAGDAGAARQLARSSGMAPDEFARLRNEARQLQAAP